MIGIDTNVLVRYLTEDDPAQVRRADAVIEQARGAGMRLHVDDVVLSEVVWVLRSGYRFGRDAIAAALDQILSTACSRSKIGNCSGARWMPTGAARPISPTTSSGSATGAGGCDHTVTLDRALRNEADFVTL